MLYTKHIWREAVYNLKNAPLHNQKLPDSRLPDMYGKAILQAHTLVITQILPTTVASI